MRLNILLALFLMLFAVPLPPVYPQVTPALDIQWDSISRVSQTTATLQVVANPQLQRGATLHDPAFRALQDLGADYVRYVAWLPYPQLAVAELEQGEWRTSLIDPMTTDFLDATKGHPVILNFSTIPEWLFKTPNAVSFPSDADTATWSYTQGKELVDGGMQELANYYAHLVSWYTDGGFTDGKGRRHVSDFHYKIPYWEVFNEPDSEHGMSPQDYTARYDAVVAAIHAVSPETKFVGLALADPGGNLDMFNYFLDHDHHRAGIPLDMISYHFYAMPGQAETPEDWQHTFFSQADVFLASVASIEQIRKKLSPETRTDLDEIGSILPGAPAGMKMIPTIYWNASGALYAYVYALAMRMGIDVVGESQLVGYPTQFPSVSMLDWKTGSPNARYWVLKLLHDHLAPGDKLVETRGATSDFLAQAFVTPEGRALLLVNKRDAKIEVRLKDEWEDAAVSVVDSDEPAHTTTLNGPAIELGNFAVAVVYGR